MDQFIGRPDNVYILWVQPASAQAIDLPNGLNAPEMDETRRSRSRVTTDERFTGHRASEANIVHTGSIIYSARIYDAYLCKRVRKDSKHVNYSAPLRPPGSSAQVVHNPNTCSVGSGGRPEQPVLAGGEISGESFINWLCEIALSESRWHGQNAPSLVVKPRGSVLWSLPRLGDPKAHAVSA